MRLAFLRPVLGDQAEILLDEPLGHPGQERELLSGEGGGEQAHPLEAPDVAVDRLLGVVGRPGDVGGEPALQVEADDRRLVGREAPSPLVFAGEPLVTGSGHP
jgi:hypothetical protein